MGTLGQRRLPRGSTLRKPQRRHRRDAGLQVGGARGGAARGQGQGQRAGAARPALEAADSPA